MLGIGLKKKKMMMMMIMRRIGRKEASGTVWRSDIHTDDEREYVLKVQGRINQGRRVGEQKKNQKNQKAKKAKKPIRDSNWKTSWEKLFLRIGHSVIL